MKLKAGQPIEGVPVDYVFLGSCTNSRISDYREAAKIFKGKKVAKGVTLYVVPGSEAVRNQMIEEGLDKIFIKAFDQKHKKNIFLDSKAIYGSAGHP